MDGIKNIARTTAKVARKNKKDITSGVLAVVVLLSLVFYGFQPGTILGATYTFNQTSWTTESADTAVHPTNQSSWAKYSAKDAGVTAGATATLTQSSGSVAHTSDTDFNGTNSSTAVSGTGASASVQLTRNTSTTDIVQHGSNITGATSALDGVAYDVTQNAVWVSNYVDTSSGILQKFNAATGAQIGSNITTGGDPIGIAYDVTQNAVWVVNDASDTLQKFDAATGAQIGSNITTGDRPRGVAYDVTQNAVWVVNFNNNPGILQKFNAATGAQIGSNISTGIGSNPQAVAYDVTQNAVWVVNWSSGTLQKFDAATGAQIGSNIAAGAHLHGVAYDVTQNAVWVVSDYYGTNSTLRKFNAATGAQIGSNITLGAASGQNIAYDITRNIVWVSNATILQRFDAATGAQIGSNITNDGSQNMAYDITQKVIWGFSLGQDFLQKFGYPYISSGNYTSASIDLGQARDLTTLSFTKTTNASTTLTVDIRAGNTASPDGTWTGWTTNISSGGSISALAGNRYIQYRANLSTVDTAYTPQLDDVTINYNYYPTSQTLTSSIYDTSDATNVMSKVEWTGSTTTTAVIKFQIRTSSNGSTWSDWLGPDGTTGSYFENSAGTEAMPSAFTSGNNDRYFQYKAYLISNGASTPTLTGVTVTYVVNAPPAFDSTFGTNGVSVSQISNSVDANFGKVQIQYAVKDTDTTTGTNSANYVTPTFEYNIGGGWVAVNSNNITWADAPSGGGFSTYGGNTTNKVLGGSYLTYTAYWDARTQIPGTYYATAQIRVTANDNEGANNTATATGGNFALDVKDVTVTAFTLDSSADTVILNLSDNNNIEYKISNSDAFTGADWNTIGGTSTSTTMEWTFTGSPSFETVYLQTKDTLGNTATISATAPSTPQNFTLYDISNPAINSYSELMSWEIYTASSTAAFSNYKVYRSTNSGASYSLLATISSADTNSYTDTSAASTTNYYYKVRVTDTNGDISGYSTAQNDQPDGQGGSDFTAPTITAVTVAETQATWVKITWTTDEMADSKVEFSTASANDYASSTTNTSYLTSHSVTITGLTPATNYIFRVKSKDILTNEGSAAGTTFTTASGPSITDVVTSSINDNGAEVTWNTNNDSNSYVIYSTDTASLTADSGVSTAGSGTAVGGSGPLYYHKVALTNLLPRTTYYYYVKSIDASSNTVTDKNSSNYYSFTTTYDTKAPVVSNISTPVKTANTLIVFWNTDELANSQVDFGVASGEYTNSGTLDASLTTGHAFTLSNLAAESTYHYRIRSADAQNNIGYSDDQTATTTTARDVVIQYVGGGGSVAPAVTDNTGPSVSNIKTAAINAFDAKISFDTNESATSFVLYGKDKTYGNVAASADLKTSGHEIKLPGLVLGTEYHYKVRAQDKFGNFSDSEDRTFTTKFATESLENLVTLENAESFQQELEGIIESIMPSLSAPFISKVEVSDVTENSAVVKWTTNIKTYGSAAYVGGGDYDAKSANPYKSEISDTQEKTKTHQVNLTNLSPSMKYHLQTKSYAIPGVVGKSKDMEFTTKSSKINPEIVKVGNTQIEIRWTTSDETSSFAEYKNMVTRQIGQKGDNAMARVHSVNIENLSPATTYEVKAYGYDANNNIVEGNTMTIKTKQDVTAPEISSIKIDNALVPGRTDRLQTIVFWKTNEPANSVVYYEEGISNNENLANKVGEENVFNAEHAVIIANFKPSTVYRIRVVSEDEAGNKTSSPIRAILTPRSAESIVDVIFKNFQESFGFLKNLQR